MTRQTYERVVVLTELPSRPGWHFGGFPYGLEPLTLPYPGTAHQPDEPLPEFDEACRRIRLISEAGTTTDGIQPCEEQDTLFWFRWITGHQVSFILWQMMALQLQDVANRGRAASVAIGDLIHYVDGYSAMLLYTGSCPRADYLRMIRPSMQLQHPSFSGGWAPDYLPVRQLLRGRLAPLERSPHSTDLVRAVRLNQVVHEHVAAKLVPDGVSLLRGSAQAVRRQDGRLLNLLYDNYFMTWREPVSQAEVTAQLLRRLVAIAQDIEVNGLAPVQEQPPAQPPAEEVRLCEQKMTPILAEVAVRAAARASDGHAREADDALTVSRTRR